MHIFSHLQENLHHPESTTPLDSSTGREEYQHKQLMRFLRLDKWASTTICGLGVSHLDSANSFPTRTCSTVSILIAASLRDSSLCPRGPELAEPHGRSGMPEDEATDKALYAKEPMGLAVLASRGLLMPNGL